MSFFSFLHLDALSAFGLIAVALMLAFYAMESRWRDATLLFAGACVLASLYGFLQGAWPFGLVEGIWSLVAFRKWLILGHERSKRTAPPDAVDAFMDDLLQTMKQIAPTTYALPGEDKKPIGFVQIHRPAARRILVHRVWAVSTGNGIGSQIMELLCDLADHHGVEIALRPLPFGTQPFPMEAGKLHVWYSRFGFNGPLKGMVRKPTTSTDPISTLIASGAASTITGGPGSEDSAREGGSGTVLQSIAV